MKRDVYLDDTDAALGEAALRYGRERFAFEMRQRQPPGQRRFDPAVWREMSEMGWLAVATSEEDGGLGLRAGSIALLARTAGASGMNEPLTSTGFVAADVLRLHATPAQRAAWLPALLTGRLRVACSFAQDRAPLRVDRHCLHGVRECVLDGDIAELVLIETRRGAGSLWHAVRTDAPRVRRSGYPLVDGRGAATLEMAGCEAEPLQPGAGEHAELVGALAASADALGAMEVAFDLTREYVATRKQFGVAIGSHQVVAHRVVDMLIRLEECRAIVTGAARALESGDVAQAYAVHAAKAYVGPQARVLAQEAVQLHGGIGIAEECAVSHCLRRTMVNEQLFGGTRSHLQRFARSSKPR